MGVRQLAEDFARYVYLPRRKSPAVLTAAVADGVGQLTWEEDTFAYAEAYDEGAGRYRGLKAGTQVRVTVTLEIDALIPDGAPENVVRTVTENSRTLKFTTAGFEEE